jgi:hypothetical protein
VRAKTGKRDRTSRKASLRKLVASLTPRATGSKTRTASHATRATAKRINGGKRYVLAPRNVVVGTLCVVAAAALLMGRPAGVKTFVADLDEKGQIERLKPLDIDPVDRALLAEAAAAASSPSSSRTTSTPVARVEAPKATAPAPAETAWADAPQPVLAPESTLKMISAPAPVANQSASMVSTSANEPEDPARPVTLAGCVERNADGFWLKNAAGDGAPSSRSWKSGFLRKKSQSIALSDRGYTHRLATYVGQRVETTGVLADREMRVKSLRVLGSCD